MACEESSSISVEFKVKGKPANLVVVVTLLKPICPSGILSLELARVGRGIVTCVLFTASSHLSNVVSTLCVLFFCKGILLGSCL